MFNKDKKTIFLKMKKGKIITVKDKETKEDKEKKQISIDNNTSIVDETNKTIENIETTETKKEKLSIKNLFIKILLVIVFIITLYFFIKTIPNMPKMENFKQISNTNGYNEKDNNKKNINSEVVEESKEEKRQKLLIKLEPIMNETNTQLIEYYSELKTNVENYSNYKSFNYDYKNFLNTFRTKTFDSYSEFLTKEKTFETEKDIFLKIRDRYANLVNTVDALSEVYGKNVSIDTFNSGLETDRQLVNDITSLYSN